MADTQEPKFWTAANDDPERLSHTTIAEAVEAWYDDTDPLVAVPETIEVQGYAPMALPSVDRIRDHIMDNLTEWLDCEYGDQIDGEPTRIPSELQSTALNFAEAVRRLYPVWSCEQVERLTVRVRDYVTVDEPEAANG